MQNFESLILIESVEKCEKMAIVLPDHMCNEFHLSLVKGRNAKHVFIGRESYTDIYSTFELYGPIPPFVIKRLHRLGESGIWQRWIKLLSHGVTNRVSENSSVQAANVNGNIVVIFILWVSGAVVGIICYLIELKLVVVQTCNKCLGNQSKKQI